MATSLEIQLSPMETPIRSIYIYNGNGVFGESVSKLTRLFSYVKGPWEIHEVGVQDVVPESWNAREALFILTGGTASEYDVHLKEKVEAIKAFVKQGGFFLSICGGSYFASKRTVYQLTTQETLAKERSLSLFEGTARGPLIPSNTDDISFHHGAVRVKWRKTDTTVPVLISGGGAFVPDGTDPNYEILVSYHDRLIPKGLSAAVVKSYVGQGRAILSSLHLGYHASDIDVSVYEKYFPDHNWQQIHNDLQGTEALRVQYFANLILAFSSSRA